MIEKIELDRIDPNPFQPREREDPLHVKEVALSIAEHSLLQTPLGRRNGDGRVQLAFGHTRHAAYKWLEDVKDHSNLEGDWSKMPVDIRDLSDLQMFEFGISENVARKDLSPIEEARAMQVYRERFGKTSAEIGKLFGLSDSAVRNKIRLVELPEGCQDAMREGKMLEGAGRELLSLFSLPQWMKDRAEGAWSYRGDGKPSEIAAQACAGASAEWVAEKIEKIVEDYAHLLSAAPWKHDQVFEGEGIRGPCKGCQERMTRKGRPYCLDRTCYLAKEKAWQRDYLINASQASGILILEDDVRNPTVLKYRDPGGEIKKSKCENLRLRYRYDVSDHPPFPDFEHAEVVCVKQNQQCSCLKGLNVVEEHIDSTGMTYDERKEKLQATVANLTPEELADQARLARKAKLASSKRVAGIRQLAEEQVQAQLRMDSLGSRLALLCVLAGSYDVQKLVDAGQALDLDEINRRLAAEIVKRIMPEKWDLKRVSDPAGFARRKLNGVFEICGLPFLGLEG
jgi:ParB/RepB/Spo0J family partition protein